MTAPVLTARQMDVLRLLADGLTDDKIGVKLHIDHSTVKTHTNGLYQRLGANGRAQAVALAYRAGLLGDPRPEPHQCDYLGERARVARVEAVLAAWRPLRRKLAGTSTAALYDQLTAALKAEETP